MVVERWDGGERSSVKATGASHAALFLLGIFGLFGMAGLATGGAERWSPAARTAAWIACAGTAYAMVTGSANRRIVEIDGGRIVCRYGPLPWPGRVSLDGGAIAGIGVETREIEQGRRTRYVVRLHDLVARCKDGERVVLAPLLECQEEARYLEDMLERRLGLRRT